MIVYNIVKKYKFFFLLVMLIRPFMIMADRQEASQLDAILAGMTFEASDSKPGAVSGNSERHDVSRRDVDFDCLLETMTGNEYAGLSALINGNSDPGAGLPATASDMAIVSAIGGNNNIVNALDYIFNAYQGNSYANSGYTQYDAAGNWPYGSGIGRRTSRYSHLMPGTSVLPIIGRVTSNFGFRPKFGRMHKGIDIALNIGDTVCAAIDGHVVKVSNDPRGYGLYVCVQHANGLETRYAHLSGIIAEPGQRIYAGEPVGLGGTTGNSTGPHLHFEVRVNGEAVDPATMFDFTTPGGYFPYRTLADLDSRNPRIASERDSYIMAVDTYKTAPGNTSGNSGKSTYIVRSGDTINSVARKNGISVLSLCRLNMLSTSDELQPGRMLKLR
ncbi:MAG: peptidoglycan DD-metalloendopeptidase family protein [Muribaculaceae bacterium]|nr:peptidoglycan DD-metalloendopeptidase family protein [Muribaculaceae bacterium]